MLPTILLFLQILNKNGCKTFLKNFFKWSIVFIFIWHFFRDSIPIRRETKRQSIIDIFLFGKATGHEDFYVSTGLQLPNALLKFFSLDRWHNKHNGFLCECVVHLVDEKLKTVKHDSVPHQSAATNFRHLNPDLMRRQFGSGHTGKNFNKLFLHHFGHAFIDIVQGEYHNLIMIVFAPLIVFGYTTFLRQTEDPQGHILAGLRPFFG